VQKAGAVDKNVTQVESKVAVSGTENETITTANQAEGNIDILQEKSIFTTNFRTSKYITLDAKLTAQVMITTFLLDRVPMKGDYLNTYLRQDEPFDDIELNGSKYSLNKPLIVVDADLAGNPYYNNEVYPLVYKNYPIDGDIKVSRNTATLGIPPVKAVAIFQNPKAITVADDGSVTPGLTYDALSYQYDVPYYMAVDFSEIQTKVINRYLYNTAKPAQILSIIQATMLPTIKPGDYKINVRYALPGKSSTWVKPVTIKFVN
jgi:hypothetical protein